MYLSNCFICNTLKQEVVLLFFVSEKYVFFSKKEKSMLLEALSRDV